LAQLAAPIPSHPAAATPRPRPARLESDSMASRLGAVFCLVSAAVAEQQNVLFLGNSFSFVSSGVWTQYKTIAEACIPGLQVSTTFQGQGAETLRMAGEDLATVSMVRDGHYDILVLQDQSELAESGYDAVKHVFAPQAKAHGALLGLYETWATPDADGKNLTQGTLLRKGYYEILAKVAREVGAEVAMARGGEAFDKVMKSVGGDWEYPTFLHLLSGDYDHPSELGLNLVAWTMVLSFNRKRFPTTGCDTSKVPNAPGQSDEQKIFYAKIACELAGVCPPEAAGAVAPVVPPGCKAGVGLQGEWVRKLKLPASECGGSSDCTYLENWVVSGTQVTQYAREGAKLHSLRVSQYGTDLCYVKLLPMFAYIKRLTQTKVMFNDCQVWTRKANAAEATVDECWCVSSGLWKDAAGDTCAAYEQGQPKGQDYYCDSTGEDRVSMFRSVRAWETCPGCQRCTEPPPLPSASARSLLATPRLQDVLV